MIYNKSGSNLSSAVVNTYDLPIINGARPKAFVTEAETYMYRCPDIDEAYYLSAILNAPCVDAAIKIYQTRGIYVGPRHIHRRPFEVCPIPQFDPSNSDHQQLVLLSQQAHTTVAQVDLTDGGVVAVRKKARQAARSYIEQIDAIAQRMLGLAPASAMPEDDEEAAEEGAEEEEQ